MQHPIKSSEYLKESCPSDPSHFTARNIFILHILSRNFSEGKVNEEKTHKIAAVEESCAQ